MFLVLISTAIAMGATFGLLIRTELTLPGPTVVSTGHAYNRLFTLHGTIMIFLFIIPSMPASFGNFVLPLMLGARDVAFPRLNLASPVFVRRRADLLSAGARFRRHRHWLDVLHALQHPHRCAGGPGRRRRVHPGLQFDFHGHQLPRHDPHDAPAGHDLVSDAFIPLALYAPAIIQVLATPVLAITLLLLAVERDLGIGIFDPGWAATQSCFSTSSGSIRIRPCTS